MYVFYYDFRIKIKTCIGLIDIISYIGLCKLEKNTIALEMNIE